MQFFGKPICFSVLFSNHAVFFCLRVSKFEKYISGYSEMDIRVVLEPRNGLKPEVSRDLI